MITAAMVKHSAILAAFAVVTTGVVVLTANATKSQIDHNRSAHLEQRLRAVFPQPQLDEQLAQQAQVVAPSPLLGTKKPSLVYIAHQDQENAGVILEVVAPEGYGGAINLLVGVDLQGTITGVRVVPPHAETPGLGDAIEVKKSGWIKGFNGKSLANTSTAQWAVKKDGGKFDSFTGATITPRAVVNAVHGALQYFANEQHRLLAPEAIDSTLGEAPDADG